MSVDRAARSILGIASVGIGLLELFAPRRCEAMLGLQRGRQAGAVRALGVRELAHGLDLLLRRDPRPGVHARLAGDGVDGALLAVAAARTRAPGSFAATAALVLGVVVLDVLFARRLARTPAGA